MNNFVYLKYNSLMCINNGNTGYILEQCPRADLG